MAQQNDYLASPSAECCLKGSLHEGQPRGEHVDITGIDTYITRPHPSKANGHILLYFPDVWGFFNNGFLIMDGFADAGYLTIGLDYFRGDPVWKHRKNRHDHSNPDFDYEEWKQKHIAFADKAVPPWVEAVKQQFGKPDTKYACVGYCNAYIFFPAQLKLTCVCSYCFGAPYVCDELAGTTCSAGAFAHPAFLKDHHFTNLQSQSCLSETKHLF